MKRCCISGRKKTTLPLPKAIVYMVQEDFLYICATFSTDAQEGQDSGSAQTNSLLLFSRLVEGNKNHQTVFSLPHKKCEKQRVGRREQIFGHITLQSGPRPSLLLGIQRFLTCASPGYTNKT